MNKDLYFIPILARAFDQADRVEALQKALAEIERLGELEPYRFGLQQFHRFMADASHSQTPGLCLEKDGVALAELDPSQAIKEIRIPGMLPGSYSVRLATGRLLWAAKLEKEDLQWAYAFPSEALRLAAESDESRVVCTREFQLLQDEVIVRVYPGIESGTIGIRISP
jgi:hypothetical protein